MLNDNLTPNHTSIQDYNHANWITRRRILRFLLKTIAFPFLVKLDRVEGINNIPTKGPAILYFNHIAFVDPIILVYIVPRDIVPLAKIEVYDYPIIGIFPKIWGVIPVRREEVDRRAVRQALAVLQAEEILLLAPEGTRHPQMSQAKVGLAYLAVKTSAPLVPVAIEGTKGFPAFRLSNRWRQDGGIVRFGKPFHFRSDIGRVDHQMLRKMADEAMYILAAMLPEHLRGYYSNLSLATDNYIQW